MLWDILAGNLAQLRGGGKGRLPQYGYVPALLFQKHLGNHCLRMFSSEVTPDCTVRILNLEGSLSPELSSAWAVCRFAEPETREAQVASYCEWPDSRWTPNRDVNKVTRQHPACYISWTWAGIAWGWLCFDGLVGCLKGMTQRDLGGGWILGSKTCPEH